jgi:hypothetical protein
MVTKLIASSLAIASLAAPAFAKPFPDVSPENWAYQAIQNLGERYGCVVGFPDGTFKPNATANRSQLAAMMNACLDRITEYQNEADARLAAALKEQAEKWSGIQKAIDAKNQGVGNYVGLSVLLNEQGVEGNGYSDERIVAGGSLQGRYSLKTFSNQNAVSVRPYLNAVAGPSGEIGTAGGALLSYDLSVAKRNGVSSANLYGGVGYQAPLVNNSDANFQSAIGDRGQVVFSAGLEGRLSNSLVGFGQFLFPTTESGTSSRYTPVFMTGLGVKF